MRRRTLLAAAPVLLAAACTSAPPPPAPIAVFFTADSATLDPEAEAVVKAAAQAAKSRPGLDVVVLGFAGPAGGVAYNVALSQARAQHVADLLAREGVARERIRIAARGPVPFEAMATESRRVEIRIGG
jgi:outer membrane protein OmpA-like peptidoglycan-associated protein